MGHFNYLYVKLHWYHRKSKKRSATFTFMDKISVVDELKDGTPYLSWLKTGVRSQASWNFCWICTLGKWNWKLLENQFTNLKFELTGSTLAHYKFHCFVQTGLFTIDILVILLLFLVILEIHSNARALLSDHCPTVIQSTQPKDLVLLVMLLPFFNQVTKRPRLSNLWSWW